MFLANFHQRRKPVQPRHHHIEQNQIDLLCLHLVQCLHTVAGRQNFISLDCQKFPQRIDNLPVIVYYQNCFHFIYLPLFSSIIPLSAQNCTRFFLFFS